jgi:Lhr-like helicase
MYFLINQQDHSVNFVSENPIPDFMTVSYPVYRKELPVDHLPEDMNLVDCFYDPETDSIIPNALGLQRITEQEFAEYINQQQLINQSISQQDTENYNKLVNFLAQVFPDNPAIQEILSDSTVTQDELQQIEDMLNNQ